jgi:hypothetical protein
MQSELLLLSAVQTLNNFHLFVSTELRSSVLRVLRVRPRHFANIRLDGGELLPSRSNCL